MKPKDSSRLFVNSAAIIVATFATPLGFAASATWNGTTDATWANGTNWSATPVPGTTDTATFNNAGGAVDIIDLGAGVTIKSVLFDTATAAAYTLGSGAVGSQTLALEAAGAITANATIANNQLVNATLNLGSSGVSESFTITNHKTATNNLTLAGGVSTMLAGLKGLTVNSAGITNISGAITDGSGTISLAKTGAGTLTLSGVNNYSGGTTVTGILNASNSSALGTGGVTINGAAGNQLQLGNGVNVANALTISGGGIAAQGVVHVPTGNATYSGTISVALQNAGGHLATAGYVGNALTIAGDNTITNAGTLAITIRNGTIIISGAQSYTGGTSMNGAAFVQFGKTTSMPATGTVATIANGVLAINAGGAGEFTGGAGAGAIGGLLAGTGGQGAPVTWLANTTMGIDTTNAAGNVTHSGAWTPSVAVGLIKLGSGTLELTGGGTYASTATITGFPFIARQGTLLLNGGTHTVTGEAVIGGLFGKANGDAGLAAKLQVDSGTLAISGYFSVGRGNGVGGVTSDLVANNAAIITAANLSAGYSGNSALNLPKGTITLNNISSLTLASGSAFNLAESAGSNMTMTLNDSATVSSLGVGFKAIGNGGTGILTLNGFSSASFGTGPITGTGIGVTIGNTAGNGTLNINASSAVSFAGQLNVGYNTGTGNLTMTGGTWTNTGEVRVGGYDTGNTATPNGSGTFTISGGTATLGALTLARGSGSLNTVSGTGTISGTAIVNSASDVTLGYAGNGNLGKLTVSGGTFNVGTAGLRWLRVGTWDTSKGQLDVTGGTIKLQNNSALKFNAEGTIGANVVNQSGGSIIFYSDGGTTVGGTGDLDLQRSGAAASNNTYNLNGGTLTVPRVSSSATTGTRTFNFNGGTLKAAAASATFMNLGTGTGIARANVRNNGAIIDSNGVDITTAQVLEHSNLGGDLAIDGGLTKQAAGTLSLTAASTYTGPTLVSGGTLTLSGSGAINSSSSVTINGSGAKFIQANSGSITPPVTLTQGTFDGNGTLTTMSVANALGNTVTVGSGSAATLTVGTLTFDGAATLNLRANGIASDEYIITSNLTTSPSADVVVNATNISGVWTSGTVYPLIEFATYGVGDTSHFTLGTVPGLNPNQSATLVNTGSSIALSITGESLIWTGTPNANWTIGGSTNWSYLGSPIGFSNNSPVFFDDTASSFAVNLGQNVTPSATVFGNSASDYTLSSTGGFGITTGTLVLNGFGKVTLTTHNTYTGSTVINSGILEISGTGSIAASSSIIDNGELIFNLSGSPNIYANPITGAGNVTKRGAGALTLSGANTFSGDFTLEAGALNFNSASALGAGAGTIIINGGTIDNTSGATVTSTSTKPQIWNTNISFLGSNSLATGTGAVTLSGAGTSRSVNVSANTFGVGGINGTGYDLVKTGAGTLNLNGVSNITGVLDIQGGIVGLSQDFFAAAPIGTGTLQNSGLVGTKWTFWNGDTNVTSGVLIRNNDGTNTRQLGIIKRGTGTLTLTNNANFATSNLSVDSGKIVLNNTGTYGARNDDGTTVTNLTSLVGNTAGADGALEINGATVNYNNRSNAGAEVHRATLSIGNNGTGAGVLKLIAGSLTTNKQLAIGSVAGAFGAMTQTGGTASVGGFLAIGLGASKGVFNLAGGTYTMTTGPVTNGAGAGSVGLMNLSGSAVYNHNSPINNAIWIGENGVGTLNVSGSAALTIPSNGIQLGTVSNAAASGTLNLLGGTVTTNSVSKPGALATGILNFNGGTLAANVASATFLTGLTNAYVHSGGGMINNGGNAITIGQALLAPTGNGVSASGLTVSGGGYIATPIVGITGDGTGATAVATIDSNGDLTGITITNPGVGYTNSSVTLSGGGVGNTGSVGGSLSATPNVSGGMTFTGAAITTLSGVNTYTGDTTVNASSAVLLADNAGLKFAPTANGVSNKVTGAGSAYIYGDFTIDLTGAAVANGNSWTLVDTAAKTFDALTFTVHGFTETTPGIHQLVDGTKTWTFTESTGALTLAVAAPAGYVNWVSGFGLALVEQDPTDDPDSDGFNNLLEYVLGGNPAISSTAITPTGVKSGSNYILTFKRSDLSEGDTTQYVEYGNDLTVWGSYTIGASPGVAPVAIAEDSPTAGLDTVTVTIPTAGATEFFARVKVVK